MQLDNLLNYLNEQISDYNGVRWATLATFSDEYPNVRNVILRHFKDNEIFIFTHSKARKVYDIEKNNKVSLLWYGPNKKLQMQIYGSAEVVRDEDAKVHLDKVRSLKDYMGGIPGEVFEEVSSSQVFFTVIRIFIHKVEALQIGSEEHLKYRFNLADNTVIRINP